MASSVSGTTRLVFDAFEVDMESGELFKKGFRVRIQGQPFKILCILLEKPGQLVSRSELQLRVWGPDTIVDFDHSMAAAINKLREALGDSAEHPRFVETLARRGYRFIGEVSSPNAVQVASVPQTEGHAAFSTLETAIPLPAATKIAPPQNKILSISAVAMALIAFAFLIIGLVVGGFFVGHKVRTGPTHIVAVTPEGNFSLPRLFQTEDFVPIVTDGVRLFASVQQNGRHEVVATALSGGGNTEVSLPSEVASARIADISPDGTRLLLRSNLSRDSEQPLWIASTMGGSARRVGSVVAHDATWMPNGDFLLYANGNALYTLSLSDNTSNLYAELPGRAFWMRWSPDGKMLRFTVVDPILHTASLWELARGSSKPRPLLREWHGRDGACCGVWTASGESFVFQANLEGSANLWRLVGSSTEDPEQLTNGPLQYFSPVSARVGERLYFLGKDTQTLSERYDAKTRAFARGDALLRDALRIAYSVDGKWVAWTTAGGSVWRSRVDGSDQLQLTPPGLTTFSVSWSPDGTSLAAMAHAPGEAWKLYLLPANGGQPQLLLNDGRNAADPSWAPDGRSLAFGRTNDAMGKEMNVRDISILTLNARSVRTVPDSDGLFSPRWSPDGRFIAALSLDGREAKVFDTAEQRWSKLPVDSAADPIWSPDGKSLWIQQFADPFHSVVRISFPDLHRQEEVHLIHGENDNALAVYFSGVTPAGDLLIRTQTSTGNIYSLSLAP